MNKSIYRVFRPKTFNDVVGQEHITKTLKNQIQNNHLAHAYLFCGTRGTGKTSTAKILSRAINCLNPQDNEPCNECEICKGILNESLMDVVEIDAASNNGVDDIRELRENVKYPPSKAKYKVYIIDEVHMLSTGAFNALLKTLEEPPSYVVFILATTEMHKLPATILSRCQRFDVKRITLDDIKKRVEFILSSLNIEYEEEATKLIARSGEGSLRDALSLLDKCISFNENKLLYEDLINLLGVTGKDELAKLSNSIFDLDVKQSMEIINEVVSWGKDLKVFVDDLIEYIRTIMLCKISNNPKEILNLTDEEIQGLTKLSTKVSNNEIIRIINILSETENKMKYTTHKRMLLELSVLKLSQPSYDESIEAQLTRLDKLENLIKSGNINISSSQNNNEKRKDTKIPSNEEKEPIKTKKVVRGEEKEVFNKIKSLWRDIFAKMKEDKKLPIQAMLKEGTPYLVENNSLIIKFKDDFEFHRNALNKDANRKYIKSVITTVTGYDINIDLKLAKEIDFVIVEEEDLGEKLLKDSLPEELIEIRE
ncbi:MAG: DNA polymerase III subunit gamma/tau [Peptostreptococcaceae bacterium]|jgi:DNA polymerase-3 subunit gamma/tau|nr:DNA polymerase III subunit gamma/tau [Peptostreptococcaceae bacterium]